MISMIMRFFVTNADDFSSSHVRKMYAIVCSVTGICFNIILCIGKLVAGTMSGSVAITADGLNNLADAGTSLVLIFGFLFAGFGAGRKHPFGHGRIEWLMGLFTSIAVIFMGLELARMSWESIKSPTPLTFKFEILIILIFSIAIKVYMFFYNKRIGKKIDSAAMGATAADSLSDVIATMAVLISMLISHFTSFQIDGWCGILVSFFIMYAGCKEAGDTIDRIIGKAPAPQLLADIQKIVGAYPQVLGIYNLIIHDYGFGRRIISLHIEGSPESNVEEFHKISEKIAYKLYEKLGCVCNVQIDFIISDIEIIKPLFNKILNMVQNIDPNILIENFRITKNQDYESIFLDVLLSVKQQALEGKIQDNI